MQTESLLLGRFLCPPPAYLEIHTAKVSGSDSRTQRLGFLKLDFGQSETSEHAPNVSGHRVVSIPDLLSCTYSFQWTQARSPSPLSIAKRGVVI